MTHQATFDFIEPDLVSIFHRTRLLATTDNVGMGFEEAHDLLLGRHLFPLQDPSHGLVDDLFGTRQEGFQGLCQTLGFDFATVAQMFLRLAGHFQ